MKIPPPRDGSRRLLAVFAVILALAVVAFWTEFRHRETQEQRPPAEELQQPALPEPAFQRASSLLGFDTGALRGMGSDEARRRLGEAAAAGLATCTGLEAAGAGRIACTLQPRTDADTEAMTLEVTLDADSVIAVRAATPGSISRWEER